MTTDLLIERVEKLIQRGQDVVATSGTTDWGGTFVDDTGFSAFRSGSLSFLRSTFGGDHSFAQEFDQSVESNTQQFTSAGIGILTAARDELVGGWVETLTGLVSAEIFTDFLVMAEHLLENGYKDAAAVMVGTVLEQHLRRLALVNGVATIIKKKDKDVPTKADTINAGLTKAMAYGKTDQKQVTAWLGTRNDAAHGDYDKYDASQVALMSAGVTNFIARVPAS